MQEFLQKVLNTEDIKTPQGFKEHDLLKSAREKVDDMWKEEEKGEDKKRNGVPAIFNCMKFANFTASELLMGQKLPEVREEHLGFLPDGFKHEAEVSASY